MQEHPERRRKVIKGPLASRLTSPEETHGWPVIAFNKAIASFLDLRFIFLLR
jgi:hypothetical protein